jgi:AraC-like DNA-binding protein
VLHYVARPPAPPLAKLVDSVWASQGAPAHAKERVVPTGRLTLIVDLIEDRRFSGAIVAGAYRRPFVFDTRQNASIVGVHFSPGCAGVVLGLPPGELTDRHVDLEAMWGRRARELRERLCAATTTQQRFAILEAELASRLDARQLHPAVSYAVDGLVRPGARVREIAKGAGLSQRSLIERFTAAVGVTPKRFGRILRFQRAAALARRSTFDWTRIAHECGYYDQAHLINEFRELAAVKPTELSRASTHPGEHHQLAVLEG